jgi:hypothetical protein
MNQAQQHLKESEMSYWAHLGHSIKQSNRLIVIALKSYVHGVLPWFFASDGPLGVYQIYREIRRMHHVQKLFKDENH